MKTENIWEWFEIS